MWSHRHEPQQIFGLSWKIVRMKEVGDEASRSPQKQRNRCDAHFVPVNIQAR